MNAFDPSSVLSWLAAGMPETAPGVIRVSQYVIELLGLEGGFEAHGWWLSVLLPLVAILIMMGPIVTMFPMFAIWLERKVSAHMQSRLGPMEIGWHGWLQSVADGVKLLAKEDIIPLAADRVLFILGPIFAFVGVFLVLAVIPFAPYLSVTDMHLGVVFFAAVGSVEVIGILMAGWGSNNKWALFGTMRLATQLVSYEIPLGLCLVSAVLVSGSLRFGEVSGDYAVVQYQRVDAAGAPALDKAGQPQFIRDVQGVNALRKLTTTNARRLFDSELDAAVLAFLRLNHPVKTRAAGAVKSWREVFKTSNPAKGFYTFKDGTTLAAAQFHSGVVAPARAKLEAVKSLENRIGGAQRAAIRKAYGSELRAITGPTGQAGWLYNWVIFRNPFMGLLFLIFYTATLAENKRAPFDLPEAESELVAGFHTEYSGMRFSIFFLAEYIAMFAGSVVAAVLFLGGWNTGIAPVDGLMVVADPYLPASTMLATEINPAHPLVIAHVAIGHAMIMLKALALIFVQMWLRWTLPRVRLDHVMDLCLKVLLPFSLVGVLLVGAWELFLGHIWQLRIVFMGIALASVGAWAQWFWFSFQAPLQTSLQEKPWDTSTASMK